MYVLAIIKNGKEMWDQAKNDGGKTEDNVKMVGGKVVGGIINESKEEEEDDDKGHQKCCSNRGEK